MKEFKNKKRKKMSEAASQGGNGNFVRRPTEEQLVYPDGTTNRIRRKAGTKVDLNGNDKHFDATNPASYVCIELDPPPGYDQPRASVYIIEGIDVVTETTSADGTITRQLFTDAFDKIGTIVQEPLVILGRYKQFGGRKVTAISALAPSYGGPVSPEVADREENPIMAAIRYRNDQPGIGQ